MGTSDRSRTLWVVGLLLQLTQVHYAIQSDLVIESHKATHPSNDSSSYPPAVNISTRSVTDD